jgi:glucose/arabinose dehydrogenase
VSASRSARWRLVTGCAGLVLLAACATFPEQPPAESWQPRPRLTPQAGPTPESPGTPGGPGGRTTVPSAPTSVPPPQGCTDFHPAVIGTCLDQVTAVAALPTDGSVIAGLVGERITGRIMRVQQGQPPVEIAKVPVDGGSDGGLTGLALSPSYAEDQLIFAYVTTATDNRLVRLAQGERPKPVLTGIPKGPTGNRGSLASDHGGALLLATGNAGNPALADDPGSLAGKVLRINAAGKPAAGNPTADSAVVAAGLQSPGGVCSSLDGGLTWVTDRAKDRDVVYRLELGKPLGAPAWSWPDRPGVAGCAAWSNMLSVAMSTAGHLQNLPLSPEGTFTGKPQITMADAATGFGRLSGVDLLTDEVAIGGTVNKAGGTPVSSDDRAVIIVHPFGGGAGTKD